MITRAVGIGVVRQRLEADVSGERVEIQATNYQGAKKLENPIEQSLKAPNLKI